MLNYYQPFLLPFLHLTRYAMPYGVKRRYFISFEDALWNVCTSRKFPKGAVILLPNFYCMDVVENIRAHGYTPILYPLDVHFQIQKKTLELFRKKYSPHAIVFFHACGIQNTLLSDRAYIRNISKKTLIIEDAVHKLLNPEEISLVCDNHIVLDSLRKTSPLPGSFLYGTQKTVDTIQPPYIHEYVYLCYTFFLFVLFRLVFVTGIVIHSDWLIRFAHTKILKKHDDVIGDSRVGHAGMWHIPFIHSFIHFRKIEMVKREQTTQYLRTLNKTSSTKHARYSVRIPEKNFGLLHVYPIGYILSPSVSHDVINSFFEKHGIPIWTKYPDCPWSKKRAVVFLPLGFHVGYNEIDTVCRLINGFRLS